jgi:hypothetical protein
MGSVTCVMMDVVTEKSGHTIVPNAVSVCTTPAAPSPLPIPYPVVAQVAEGISDTPMRTKINGSVFATTGSVIKTCHGNEPGTLKEVVSLNTAGPVFPIMGAPVVLSELGMVAITGSMCVSNKAPTPGAGGSASGAGGSSSGGGAGSSGSGDGSEQDNEGPDGGGGDGGDGTNDGASATPATPEDDRYCPDSNRRAPPPFEDNINQADLRNRQNEIINHGSPDGRRAANHARYGAPGGTTPGTNQAFWSGGRDKDTALANIRGQGYSIQEDEAGAGGLERMGGALPAWGSEAGDGSGITGERLWRTISRRSAENASGSVDAFVVGTARPGNVFSDTELPTLLHNDNLSQINFRDPFHQPPPAPVVQSWNRGSDGCWEGGAVPGAGAGGSTNGFRLHGTQGITRPAT